MKKNKIKFSLYQFIWLLIILVSQSFVQADEKHPVLDSGSGYSLQNSHNGAPRFYLSPTRMAAVEAKYDNGNGELYLFMLDKIDGYLNSVPYNTGEFAVAFALASILSTDPVEKQLYQNRAIELLWEIDELFDSNNLWYQSRNGFRGGNIWPSLVFNWLHDELTPAQKTEALAAFKVWGDYWAAYVRYDNVPAFDGYRFTDSDETTSLAENFLLLGLLMAGETGYESDSARMLEIGDAMLNGMVVDLFMHDFMQGGLWGEGVDYSPRTSWHWISAFLLNQEQRGIAYPSNYGDLALQAMVHSTFPGFGGMFIYGDMEAARDYTLPREDYRYDYMLMLTDLVSDANLKGLGQHWINTVRTLHGLPPGSGYTGIWRMLFESPGATALSPEEISLATTFRADGLEFVSMRDNWGDSATVIYFQAAKKKVDHMHNDALSFNILRNGRVVSKENSGYVGLANYTMAHNSLLIESKDPYWGSNITGRGAGDGEILATESAADFAYVSAEAADIYNYIGWQGVTFVDNVIRKLVWLKPGFVLVKDYVKLVDDGVESYPGSGVDGNTYNGNKRRVKYIQHFQTEPQDILGDGIYSASSEGQKLFFKTISPANVTTTVVNEATTEPYLSSGIVASPLNQRKWHITVMPDMAANTSNLLHLLYVDDDSATTMPVSSPVEAYSGNMAGARIQDGDITRLVMFSNSHISVDSVTYNASIFPTIVGVHTLVDIVPGAYNVYRDGDLFLTNIVASSQGVLKFESIGGSVFQITPAETGLLFSDGFE